MTVGEVVDVGSTRHLDRGSLATAASVGFNALGGLVFWFLAARDFDADQVGQALGLFQAMLFVHYLTQLGLPVVIAHYGSKLDESSAKVSAWAQDTRAIATLVIVPLFLLVTWGSTLTDPLREAPFAAPLFVLLAVGAGAGTLAEMRLVGRRSWLWVVGRTAIPVTARIPILLLGVAATGYELFLVAAVPICVIGFLFAGVLRFVVDRAGHWWTGDDVPWKAVRRFALANWGSMLATEGPIFAAPVIVAASVSSRENAPFLVAWSISTMTFVLPHMMSQVLLSEASKEEDLKAVARRAYILAQTVTCTVTLVAWAGAGVIADLYGSEYADLETQLPILVGANIAWVVTTISLSVARAREQSKVVLGLGLLFAVSTLGMTLILAPTGGATAAGWAWFGGNCLTALVALWSQRDVWRS